MSLPSRKVVCGLSQEVCLFLFSYSRSSLFRTTPLPHSPAFFESATQPPHSKKSGQHGLPAHFGPRRRRVKRCVRPAVGITSASHQNTARAAYRCTVACPGFSPEAAASENFPRRVTLQMPARVFVRRCTTSRFIYLGAGAVRLWSFLHDRLAGLFSCGVEFWRSDQFTLPDGYHYQGSQC